MNSRALVSVGAAGLALAALASPAEAQTIQAVDQILAEFQGKTGAWAGTLRNLALGTFAALAAIQFAWAMIRAALAKHDMAEVMGELVNQAIFLGFFSFLLLNAATLGTAIIAGFRYAAGQSGGVGVTPGEVLALGINLADKAVKGIGDLPYAAMPGAIICCVVILVLFAIMTAQLLTTVAKSYFWINAGVFFFGFGGSVWTKEYAVSMVRHLVAIGAELFTLQLLLSLCMSFVRGWVAAPSGPVTLTSIFVQIACACVMMVLVWEVPKEAQRMISGSVVNGPGLVGAAATLTAAVAAAGAAMAGAGVMVAQAVKLAEAQIKAAEGGSGAEGGNAGAIGSDPAERSRVAHAAAVTGRALGNMAAAPFQDIGRRLSGQSLCHGSTPWRMAADMGNQARLLNGDAAKPALGGGVGAGAFGMAAAAYQPWMSMSGGYNALSPAHQASADRSYAAWEQSNPQHAAKYDVHDYVSYVQDKQAEREGRVI